MVYLIYLLKDEVLLTVGCPIFLLSILIAKYLFTGSLRKIDQLIVRNAKEIYFNEKFPILYLFTLCRIEINLK
jgi:hypothetical protein